jgi:hypothetical protein
MSRTRRGVGRTEILIGVAVVVVLGAIAIPLVWNTSRNSARQEVPLYVNAIREFEFAYHQPFDEYVSADSAPREAHEVTADPVAWVSNSGFDKIGWTPEDELVYGSYRVSATADGFTVTGTCDIDGDGVRAIYEATDKEEAKAKTDDSIF